MSDLRLIPCGKRHWITMHVTPDYCRLMARYNAWQNSGLCAMVEAMPESEYTRDRGAFFGSIRHTLNHLLWADQVWMHRFAKTPMPGGGIRDSVTLTPTAASWGAERFRMDARITTWADRLNAVDLVGRLHWYSGAAGRDISQPLQRLVVHMFNHQTHHRGQVHAMLTAAGLKPPATDLFLMPD